MARHQLPDDMSAWPHDQYQLLGVSHQASERDIRLAYTRLIRKYKPEIFPEQFRRIREAYEFVRQFSSLPEEFHSPPWNASLEMSAPRPGPAADTGVSPPRPSRESPPEPDSLEAAWDAACNGQLRAAYRRLVDAGNSHPGRPIRYTMLYWLLLTAPRLDPSRMPLEWLLEGVRACGYCESLGELLNHEHHVRPLRARSRVMSEFLESPPAEIPWNLFYRWRWAAYVGRPDCLQIILADLQSARQRVELQSTEMTRLLIEAVRHLAWLRHRSPASQVAFARYREQLSYFDILDEYNWELDRLDWEIEVADACCQFGEDDQGTRHLRRALELYCRRGMPATRRPLLAWLSAVSSQPADGIDICASLVNSHPIIWARAVQLVEALVDEPYVGDDVLVSLEPAVFTFFNRASRATLEELRLGMLELCMREMISPATLSRVMQTQAQSIGGTIEALASAILEDSVMRVLYAGYRLCHEPTVEQTIAATLL